jgi:hypothetical protein
MVAMRLFSTVLLLTLCLVLGGPQIAAQDAQTSHAVAKPLTNADVLDMLKVGLSPEIVIAKIRSSPCEFDTEPATLKVLKAANLPDAVILAMVQAPSGSPTRDISTPPMLPSVHEGASAGPFTPARVDCNQAEPVPVFPMGEHPFVENGGQRAAFTVKCGDRITIVGPTDKQTWLEIRTDDGQVGYISSSVVTKEKKQEDLQKETDEKKREDTQKAKDDLEDCRLRSQNEYETKMNAVGALTLTPLQRVYASSRLKQNLDAELRVCRSQYELRLKTIQTE